MLNFIILSLLFADFVKSLCGDGVEMWRWGRPCGDGDAHEIMRCVPFLSSAPQCKDYFKREVNSNFEKHPVIGVNRIETNLMVISRQPVMCRL